MADSRDPKSNVPEHGDGSSYSGRGSNADPRDNGERTSAAAVPFPQAAVAVAYTVGEAQQPAAEAAGEPAGNTQPSR